MPLDGNPSDYQTEQQDEVFSLRGLIAWLEKQPAWQRYDFMCNQCMFGRYFTEKTGRPIRCIGTATVTFHDGTRRMLPDGWNDVAQAEPHAYGKALSRARSLAEKG